MVGKLKLVGLTGGIGSGKSTVGRIVQEMGIPLIDADRLAREVVAPGLPAHAEVAAAWPQVVAPDGQIDRRALSAVVFADPEARRRLEAITHPRINQLMLQKARALEQAGHRLAFYEASLLVEAGRARDFDALVVVTAGEEQQIARTIARDGRARQEVLARLRAQLPLEEKRKLATHLIDNSGTLEQTRRQTETLVRALGG